MIGKRTITHCIFDMDGLLLDTEQIYTKVTQAILDKHVPGKTFTWDVKARIMGMTSLESGRIVVDTYQLPLSVEDYLEEAAVMQELMWPEVPLLPGVERLLRHLHASGIPMVVATSSTREKFELKTTKHRELFSLFASVTCGDDPEIRRGKPAPDIFLVAREKLGNPPLENCLIFEDAFMGLQAAKAAGMACVWVPDERILEIVGRDHGAAAIYRSMLEFDAVKFGIPSMGIIWRASNFLIPETETEPQINSQPTALIILNQAISNKKLFEAAWAKAFFRVCADGGANRLYNAFSTELEREKYIPNYICGDFDSLDAHVRDWYSSKGTKLHKDADQDSTDLQKCLHLVDLSCDIRPSTPEAAVVPQNQSLLSQLLIPHCLAPIIASRHISSVPGPAESAPLTTYEVVVLGGFDGRLDHVMSNINALFLQRRKIYLVSESSVAFLLRPGKNEIFCDKRVEGPTCGLIPIGVAKATVVTQGLKWNLDRSRPLAFGGLVSSSNAYAEGSGEVALVQVEADQPIVWTAELRF